MDPKLKEKSHTYGSRDCVYMSYFLRVMPHIFLLRFDLKPHFVMCFSASYKRTLFLEEKCVETLK